MQAARMAEEAEATWYRISWECSLSSFPCYSMLQEPLLPGSLLCLYQHRDPASLNPWDKPESLQLM